MTSSQEGTAAALAPSRIWAMSLVLASRWRGAMTSPVWTGWEGTVTVRPLIWMWPWVMSWRAWGLEAASPRRATTLSRRCSSRRRRF